MKEALRLLRLASAHVYRQQFAGRHEQDRRDAKELSPLIAEYLREHNMATTKKKSKKKTTKKTAKKTTKKKPPPRTSKKTTKKPISKKDDVQQFKDRLHNVEKRLAGLEELDLEEALTFAITKIEELETRLANVEKVIDNAMEDDDGTE